MLYTSSLIRWLQRKRYQYEVTFSLYMLTPTEKFVFNSFLFLFLSMIVIAASLYLPEHVSIILRRASFYWGGDENAAAGNLGGLAAVKGGMGSGSGAGPGFGGGGEVVLDGLGVI